MYSQTTRGIKITAEPRYLPEQSEPGQQYVWAYTITLENRGERTVQLLNRHWHITDSLGRSREVRGPGVVGEQPVLRPGETFEYTSGVPLETPSGIMMGEYEMTHEDGERFHVTIPAFSLESPFSTCKPN
jgi:ApaG protein